MLRNYFAAYEGTAEVADPTLLDYIDFRLISFYQMHKLNRGRYDDAFYNSNKDRYTSLMLDSGAFTAWKQRTEISFRDYLKYCKKWAGKIDYVVNLDIIPRHKTEREAAAAAVGGYTNYRRMVSELGERGIPKEKIIHVYHQFEPLDVLKEMVDHDQMDYVGLSPDNSEGPESKRRFLEECMTVVLDQGRPKCKTHVFGLSSYDLLSDFPVYSADSQTWALQAMIRNISVPQFRDLDSRFGDPLELRWDFSNLENYDVGYLTNKPSYYLNKELGSKSATGSYRIRMHAYVYDVDREFPFPLVNGREILVGHSVSHRKNNLETLGPNEFEIDPESKLFKKVELLHGEIGPSMKLTEETIKYGLIHKLQWRMKVNIISTNYFVRQLDPEGYDAFVETERR